MQFPKIDNPEQLYVLYKLKYSEEISDDILKDCPRSNFGKCAMFKLDPRTLGNPLFNVLNAYAHYDPEVAYGQGMNYVTANILTYMQFATNNDLDLFSNQTSQVPEANRSTWPFDEMNSFYMLIYLMEDLGWREVIKPGLPGLKVMHEKLKFCICESYPKVALHLEQ